MINIYDPTSLKDLVGSYLKKDLIVMKQSVQYPHLRVVKYKRKVFFDNLWDDFLVECRGLVIDADYNVVVNPMTKIFNYGENGRYPNISHDDLIYAYRKFNGFLGCVTNHDKYGLLFSTTGSLDSEYADMLKTTFNETNSTFFDHIKDSSSNITYYFEVCHPNDPHIIKEDFGCHFLGSRYENSYWSNKELLQVTTLNDIFKSKENIEGWVCETIGGERFKIKTPYYLTTKFFARANQTKLIHLLKQKEFTLGAFIGNFDEDFCEIFEIIQEHKDEFVVADEQSRIEIIRNGLEERNEKVYNVILSNT